MQATDYPFIGMRRKENDESVKQRFSKLTSSKFPLVITFLFLSH